MLAMRYRYANRPLSLTSGSYSHEAGPLQSSNDFNHRLLTFRRKQPARVSALFATSPKRIHLTRNIPCFATVRPQAFSASRRFAPRLSSWVCFIPQPRLGFAPVQGLLPLHSHPSSSEGACPHAVWPSFAHRPKPVATNKTPRLRGLSPCRGSFLRFGVTRPVGRSPLQVLTPPGSRSSTMSLAYPKTSAHDVGELAFTLAPSSRLQRIVTENPGSSVSR